jgi:hypothetical protein
MPDLTKPWVIIKVLGNLLALRPDPGYPATIRCCFNHFFRESFVLEASLPE